MLRHFRFSHGAVVDQIQDAQSVPADCLYCHDSTALGCLSDQAPALPVGLAAVGLDLIDNPRELEYFVNFDVIRSRCALQI